MIKQQPGQRTIVIQKFDGGISDDIRAQAENQFAMTKHFDIFSNPNRLTPHRSTEADTHDSSTDTGMKQYDVRTFQYGSDGKLYGIGIQPAASTRSQVFFKADPTSGNWTAPSNDYKSGLNTSASWRNSFLEWQSKFWTFGGTTKVINCPLAGTFDDNAATVGATITHVAQSVIAPDNNMYMFYNNKVVRVSSASAVTDAVLTLPADGRITNACVYGNYLAIAWASGTTLSAGGRSRVYLWNLTAPDVSESIDWGEGQLMVIGNIEGRVVGVSDSSMSSSTGATSGSVVVRMYAGGAPQVMQELKATQTVSLGTFIRDSFVKQNKLYWVMAVPFNDSSATTSTFNIGIWAFGRRTVNLNFALTLDYVEEAIDTSNFVIKSFGAAGNYWFINHSVDGSITKTNDAATYSFTSKYDTQRFHGGDISKRKKLVGVAVSTEALPAAGQVVLKYKKDSETSFTTISTNTTDNSVTKEDISISSTAASLPEFNEIQFRVESTGGAVITGFKLVFQDAKTLL